MAKENPLFVDVAAKTLLADFGLSQILKTNQATITNQSGTYGYMGPELFVRDNLGRGKPYNPFFADIYALGIILVHMVAKQFPLEAPAGKYPEVLSQNFVGAFFASERNVREIKVSALFIDLA